VRFTLWVPPRLLRPGARVVILILVLLIVYQFAPAVAVPVGVGSWLGWLAARPVGGTVIVPALGGLGCA
jgi:hypothetical protein